MARTRTDTTRPGFTDLLRGLLTLWVLLVSTAAQAEHADAAPMAKPTMDPAQTGVAAMDASMYAGAPAIDGYSPVSYFTEGVAERGTAEFAVMHEGETYHLVSAEQVALFEADPARYVPLFGAFCAYNLSLGRATPIDPTNFRIVDGQLLLFHLSEAGDALARWEASPLTEAEQLRRAQGEFRLLEF